MPYRITLVAVFLLTVLVDLTVAVQVGLAAACLTFIYRISSLTRIEAVSDDARTQVHALNGALFFAAVQLLEDLSNALPSEALVLDFTHVIYLDSSGMDALMHLSTDCHVQGVRLFLVGLQGQPLDILRRTEQLHGLHANTEMPDVPSALKALALQG
jgi:SulP family sulfate permease